MLDIVMRKVTMFCRLISMNDKNVLTLWTAKIAYEDRPIAKPRPVIITRSNVFSVLEVTTKTRREGYMILNWWKAGLHEQSVIRIDRRLNLNENDFIKYVGKLSILDALRFNQYLEDHGYFDD